MKKLKVIILYKDKSYKLISAKKLRPSHLSDNNIKFILIPLYDNPNAYIPIKPSTLYDFIRAKVSIIYQAFVFEMEVDSGTSFDSQEFSVDCDNIIDFINAIYNVYKFRAISIYLSENNDNMTSSNTSSFIISIRQIDIKLYDRNDQLIHEINSGVMEDLSEYSSSYFWKSPPAYSNEDRFKCLGNILYIPCSDNDYFNDIDNLPICMHLKNKFWKTVKKPSKELENDDCMLYKIPEFEIYYIMEFELYNQLISLNEFEIHFISAPIFKGYDTDYLTSLDNNRIPSYGEKEEAIEAYLSGDLFNICNTIAVINSPDIFLQSMIFITNIVYYIRYFGYLCYSQESSDVIMRTFILFGRGLGIHGCYDLQGKCLLTDVEMTYDNIIEAFSSMFKKGS